jgi:hypothetical protein
LRLGLFRDAVDDFARGEIDDADGIVAELGNEQPIADRIDRHVVDPAAHIAQQYLCFQTQGLRLDRLRRGWTGDGQEHRGCDRDLRAPPAKCFAVRTGFGRLGERRTDTSPSHASAGPLPNMPQPKGLTRVSVVTFAG